MKITTTTTGRVHTISDLTDDQLMVIERALYVSDIDVGTATNYDVWNQFDDALREHGIEVPE